MFQFSFISNLFRRYADPFEKEIDHFLKNIHHTHLDNVRKDIVAFMQQDLVILNLWIEHKYKGYRYLTVKKRREIYENKKILNEKLKQFCEKNPLSDELIVSALKSYEISEKEILSQREKWEYLFQIIQFFQRGVVDFEYREGADFGGLLGDIRTQKLIGDCNQIVTLYVYLYSLRFPITDLQINLFPKHVNLHFNGVDIEATTHSLVKNNSLEYKKVPITEILAINLLDVNDREKRIFSASPKTFLEASRIAVLLSSERKLVKNNLSASFQRVVKELIRRREFDGAVRYGKESGDEKLFEYTVRSGLEYFLKENQFQKAERYVELLSDSELKKIVWRNRAIYLLNKKSIQSAEKYFKKVGDMKGIEHCYQLRFQELQKQISSIKTVTGLKKKKSVLQKMLTYARKGKNKKMEAYAKGLLGQL